MFLLSDDRSRQIHWLHEHLAVAYIDTIESIHRSRNLHPQNSSMLLVLWNLSYIQTGVRTLRKDSPVVHMVDQGGIGITGTSLDDMS